MGVPCPRCGRSYDVTLFAFGRTLHCACGERVGLAQRLSLPPSGAEPRFLADAMLGRLARWLRLLGIDTAYEPHIADGELVRRSLEEERVVLTRDRALPEEWRIEHVHLVEPEGALAQLREVVQHFGLAGQLRPFTRCSRCNTPLVDVAPDAVGDRVPPRVRATEQRLRACPSCGRVYWSGSHTRRMRRVIERLRGDSRRGS